MKEYMELTKAVVKRVDPDVLITEYKPNTVIEEKDAEEIDSTHLTMAQGSEMFIIADLTSGEVEIKRTAIDYFVNRGKMIPYTRAVAFVSTTKESFFARLFGKNKTSKTFYPTKQFDSLDEANKWFDTLRK